MLRSIPEAINRRLSNISSVKHSFYTAIPPYQEALKRSGYGYNLNFNLQPPNPKRQRSRNVLWFNQPFSANVATNIGHKFLRTVDECLPLNHPLGKIFNKNTLKLSYSCMPNMKNIIATHNKYLLNRDLSQPNPTPNRDFNCHQKGNWPLSVKCQAVEIVYQATVKTEDNGEEKTYVGLTEGTFKTRFNNHNSSFRNLQCNHATD